MLIYIFLFAAVSLIKTLFIIFIAYYIVKFLVRFLLAGVVNKAVKKNAEMRSNGKRGAKSGDVTIEYNDTKRKYRTSPKEGEYVEYEEVDE